VSLKFWHHASGEQAHRVEHDLILTDRSALGS
jgi:hypothetical protein